MKISQMNSVLLKGDAISNIIRTIDKINKEQGLQSSIVLDFFSEFYNKNIFIMANYDYGNALLHERLLNMAGRFLRLENKKYYLSLYLKAKEYYQKNKAKDEIESSQIRIWHYGTWYSLLEQFHSKDIFFFEGITFPYLLQNSSLMRISYQSIYFLKSLDPFIITISNFLKKDLEKHSFQNIFVLPLYAHTQPTPPPAHNPTQPKLLMYGRYAKNKAVPELAKFCFENKIYFTHFGDNYQTKEFKEQYTEAKKYECDYIHILPKQPEIEHFFLEHNIYISNSYHEGFAMPVVEAEAHGLPVLCRRGTAMDELVKEGFNGYLFDDLSEIPNLIEKIMKNYKKFSQNAYKHSQNFTYEAFKRRYLELLEEYKKYKGIK